MQSEKLYNGKITFRLTFSLRTPGEAVRYDLQAQEKRQGVRNEVGNDERR